MSDEDTLDLLLGGLIDEFLVEGDNTLGDGLTDGVDLSSVSTTGDADSDVQTGEPFSTEQDYGFVDLRGDDLSILTFDLLSCDLISDLYFLTISLSYLLFSSLFSFLFLISF